MDPEYQISSGKPIHNFIETSSDEDVSDASTETDQEPEPEAKTRSDKIDDIVRKYYRKMRGPYCPYSADRTLMIKSFYNRFIKKRDKQHLDFSIDKEYLRSAVFGDKDSLLHVRKIPFEIKIREHFSQGGVYICGNFRTNDYRTDNGDIIIVVRIHINDTPFDLNKIEERMTKVANILKYYCHKFFEGSKPRVFSVYKTNLIALDMEILRSTLDHEFTFDLLIIWIEYLAHNMMELYIV
jgi:hypothetical protein